MDVGAGIFLGVQRNFAWILPNLPDKYFKISDLKKTFSCQFGRHYFQIKTCWAPFLHRFSGCFRRFLGILSGFTGFCPNFHQIKTFGGCGCTSCTPASYTSASYCLYFLACWRCNANGRSSNTLLFLRHKENAP